VEGRGFRDRIQEFSSRNAVIAGVSFDSPAKNRAFREKNAFPFDLLCDEDRSVSMRGELRLAGRQPGVPRQVRLPVRYGAAKKPRQWFARRISYLIDPEGRIARVYEKVRPGRHPDEVLAALDELGSTVERSSGGTMATEHGPRPAMGA
jgi:peroxiredoxin Q/BCP